jgi:1,4-alpha-glucan branching enzyme
VALDATDFVDHVRRRLLDVAAARGGRPGLVVAAWDTELFGHWWHEGPAFLEQVLRLLPEAGVRVSTLAAAVPDAVEGVVDLPAGSWGAGKDFRVWAGPAVADIRAEQARAQHRLLAAVRAARHAPTPLRARSPELDQLAREALLLLRVTGRSW